MASLATEHASLRDTEEIIFYQRDPLPYARDAIRQVKRLYPNAIPLTEAVAVTIPLLTAPDSVIGALAFKKVYDTARENEENTQTGIPLDQPYSSEKTQTSKFKTAQAY